MSETAKWEVVVATQDAVRPAQQPRVWPCTDHTNRYKGCIGVRRCRAIGTETCIFGRWPASARMEWMPRD